MPKVTTKDKEFLIAAYQKGIRHILREGNVLFLYDEGSNLKETRDAGIFCNIAEDKEIYLPYIIEGK